MTADLIVGFAPGTGRLVRRDSVLLFAADADSPMVVAFDGADTDEAAVNAVKQHLVDTTFQAEPIVVALWAAASVDLLVFGPIEVHSSTAAVPMITGAGSASWVERRLGAFELGAAESVEFWCGTEAHPVTDLRAGIAAADGFHLSIRLMSAAVVEQPAAVEPVSTAPLSPDVPDEPAVADEPVPPSAQPVAPPPAPAPDPVSPSAFDVPVEPASIATAPAAAPSVAEPDLVSPSPFDVPDDPAPDLSPLVMTPTAPVLDPGSPSPFDVPDNPAPLAGPPVDAAANGFDDDREDTEVSEVPADDADDVAGPDDEAAAQAGSIAPLGLVEAVLCDAGHPNRPGASACRSCAIAVAADAPISLIAQPSVGTAVFTNGQTLVVDRSVVLGRKPIAADAQASVLVIDEPEVSREHAILAVDGWTAHLTDSGSRNGTYVVAPNTTTPVRLDKGVQYVLEHGTTIHLGGPEVAFRFVVEGSPDE